MTITDNLKSALVALHQARITSAGYNEQVRIARDAWEREHILMLADQQKAKAALEQADTYARNLALAVFQETGQRRPIPGVEVKDFARVRIPDEAVALVWAIRHELALKLDTAALGKIAKAQNGIAGVAEMVTDPVATIATDLGPAVAALLGEKEPMP